MKGWTALLILAAASAGCVVSSQSPQAPQPLGVTIEQADEKLASADYGGAREAYAKFADAHPDSPQASRARATLAALNRLLGLQSELDTAKRSNETPRLLRELAERQNEVDRLKAEVAKLRADLERLRSIDLKTLPAGKK